MIEEADPEKHDQAPPPARVIPLGTVTSLDLPPDLILEGAMGKLDSVVIMGYTRDGEEWHASSVADGGFVLWLAERLRRKLTE